VVCGSDGFCTIEFRVLEVSVEREALLHLFACVHFRVLYLGTHGEDGYSVVSGVVNSEGGKGLKSIQIAAVSLASVMGRLIMVVVLNAG
jgi:hypothetical protein